ncbi:hypothetical protein BOTBODRAFT_496040 [Botryobasidium botryosum FD-172 SS1]|uniref:Uncharacterized protein n=1 Tax=Botryobasidium botryosum (strain FD-172 SS1) TaxID=930990 RepID=A0A067MFS3_BOTB1|nr:hypothetical protein BOTBODRAFT_496040 [Botryobasidium botryosum FD-172 SS1]
MRGPNKKREPGDPPPRRRAAGSTVPQPMNTLPTLDDYQYQYPPQPQHLPPPGHTHFHDQAPPPLPHHEQHEQGGEIAGQQQQQISPIDPDLRHYQDHQNIAAYPPPGPHMHPHMGMASDSTHPHMHALQPPDDQQQPQSHDQEGNTNMEGMAHMPPTTPPPEASTSTALAPDPNAFPSREAFQATLEAYTSGVNRKNREKTLLTQAVYNDILKLLLAPPEIDDSEIDIDPAINSLHFRAWVRKTFNVKQLGGVDVVTHNDRAVAVQEQLYDILVHCHAQTNHGGRDRTCAMVNEHYVRFISHIHFLSAGLGHVLILFVLGDHRAGFQRRL